MTWQGCNAAEGHLLGGGTEQELASAALACGLALRRRGVREAERDASWRGWLSNSSTASAEADSYDTHLPPVRSAAA